MVKIPDVNEKESRDMSSSLIIMPEKSEIMTVKSMDDLSSIIEQQKTAPPNFPDSQSNIGNNKDSFSINPDSSNNILPGSDILVFSDSEDNESTIPITQEELFAGLNQEDLDIYGQVASGVQSGLKSEDIIVSIINSYELEGKTITPEEIVGKFQQTEVKLHENYLSLTQDISQRSTGNSNLSVESESPKIVRPDFKESSEHKLQDRLRSKGNKERLILPNQDGSILGERNSQTYEIPELPVELIDLKARSEGKTPYEFYVNEAEKLSSTGNKKDEAIAKCFLQRAVEVAEEGNEVLDPSDVRKHQELVNKLGIQDLSSTDYYKEKKFSEDQLESFKEQLGIKRERQVPITDFDEALEGFRTELYSRMHYTTLALETYQGRALKELEIDFLNREEHGINYVRSALKNLYRYVRESGDFEHVASMSEKDIDNRIQKVFDDNSFDEERFEEIFESGNGLRMIDAFLSHFSGEFAKEIRDPIVETHVYNNDERIGYAQAYCRLRNIEATPAKVKQVAGKLTEILESGQ